MQLHAAPALPSQHFDNSRNATRFVGQESHECGAIKDGDYVAICFSALGTL